MVFRNLHQGRQHSQICWHVAKSLHAYRWYGHRPRIWLRNKPLDGICLKLYLICFNCRPDIFVLICLWPSRKIIRIEIDSRSDQSHLNVFFKPSHYRFKLIRFSSCYCLIQTFIDINVFPFVRRVIYTPNRQGRWRKKLKHRTK